MVELDGDAVGLLQRYRHSDDPAWDRAVGVDGAVGIDYLIGRAELTGAGLGTAIIRCFTRSTLDASPDLSVVCAVPQQANVGSWQALEKAGLRRARAVDQLESEHPGDRGPAYVYVFERGWLPPPPRQ